MGVIRAAFDSSKDDPCSTTVVAGYMADAKAWEAIEDQWNGLLVVHGLDTFHLSEIKHRFRDQDRWLDVVRPFAALIARSGLRSVYALLRDTDWNQSERDSAYRAKFPRREHACLDLLFEPLSDEARWVFNDEPVAAVFDNDWDPKERAGESVVRIHNDWCARSGHPGFNLFLKGGVPWGAVPLQTADLLAGLLRMNPFTQSMLDRSIRGSADRTLPLSEVTWSAMSSGRGCVWQKERIAAAMKPAASSVEQPS